MQIDGFLIFQVVSIVGIRNSWLTSHQLNFSAVSALLLPCYCRVIGLVCGAVAIVCSVLALFSCQFVQLLVITSIEHGTTLEGGIGLFSFQDPENDARCIRYDDFYFRENSSWMNEFWIVAQYASVIAPVLGASAWIMSLCEMLWWKFCGSFMLPLLLCMLALLTQGTDVTKTIYSSGGI